jgi:hypothetical protein
MSRFTKSALLLLAGFIFLGFSITVNAKPPFLDKEQLINSGPIYGQFPICMVTNTTDSAVYVDMEITWSLVSTMSGGVSTPTGLNSNPSGEIEVPANGVALHFAFPTDESIGYCTIGWEGGPGEIRGTFCMSANTVGPIDCKDAY